MGCDDDIQIDLIKLASGERLLRLTDIPSGLALEKRLDARQAVIAQKARLLRVFETALAQHKVTAA